MSLSGLCHELKELDKIMVKIRSENNFSFQKLKVLMKTKDNSFVKNFKTIPIKKDNYGR